MAELKAVLPVVILVVEALAAAALAISLSHFLVMLVALVVVDKAEALILEVLRGA